MWTQQMKKIKVDYTAGHTRAVLLLWTHVISWTSAWRLMCKDLLQQWRKKVFEEIWSMLVINSSVWTADEFLTNSLTLALTCILDDSCSAQLLWEKERPEFISIRYNLYCCAALISLKNSSVGFGPVNSSHYQMVWQLVSNTVFRLPGGLCCHFRTRAAPLKAWKPPLVS